MSRPSKAADAAPPQRRRSSGPGNGPGAALAAQNPQEPVNREEIVYARWRGEMDRIVAEDKYRIRRVFRSIDRDGSNSLTRQEFEAGMKQLGVVMSPSDMALLVKRLDTDGDRLIDYAEFAKDLGALSSRGSGGALSAQARPRPNQKRGGSAEKKAGGTSRSSSDSGSRRSSASSDHLVLPDIRAASKTRAPGSARAGVAVLLENCPEDPELFAAVSSLDHGDGMVSLRRFEKVLNKAGLRRSDPRLKELFQAIDDSDASDVPLAEMVSIARSGGQVVVDAITGNLTIPDWEDFKKMILEIYDEVEQNKGGKNASYIPVLAQADPDRFAVAITSVDGQQLFIGDCEWYFCLQSTSKPVTYGMALKEHGSAKVHQHVGREPSGQAFNQMFLKQLPEGKRSEPQRKAIPHNPMINAGAIVCTSLMLPKLPCADRIQEYLKTWKALCCEEVSFDPAVFVSERDTADRNQALAYMIKESGSFPDNTSIRDTLELYFQTCSITLNARNLAAAAATLANGGTNPFSAQSVFDAGETRDILSLMLSCGMYDYSGEWAFRIGLPAKSGVSGNVMIVVPNVMGVAIYSPPLDDLGNSVRAVEFGHKLVQRFNFHMFDSLRGSHNSSNTKIDPTKNAEAQYAEQIMQFLRAADRGQVGELRGLIARGLDVNVTDYDRRSALHLAACEGHVPVINLLLSKGAKVDVKDRWGHSPLSEAEANNHPAVVAILKKALQGK
eukprot:m.210743 g.210743  ORF g.210743 m.210743 type:complete len:726 (+) comp22119_c1_seq3:216-2393(+)